MTEPTAAHRAEPTQEHYRHAERLALALIISGNKLLTMAQFIAAAEARGAAQAAALRDALVQARPYTHSASRVRAQIDAALSATGAAP